MRVEYSRRALDDLARVAADSRASFGDDVAGAVEIRIREVVARIKREPKSARPLIERPGVHVVALVICTSTYCSVRSATRPIPDPATFAVPVYIVPPV